MKEYRVKGLSCSNCAADLEKQIQQLAYGDTARLNYNSGRLTLDPRIPLEEVERILKSDGAFIENHEHNTGMHHDHSQAQINPFKKWFQASNHRFLFLVLISAALFVAALALEFFMPSSALIPVYLAAVFISGFTTFMRGLKNLIRFIFNIDTLMTVALIGAAAIGEWKEAALVAILFGLNEWLEGLGMEKARRSVEALLDTAPKEAIVIEDGKEKTVPIASLKAGDIVLVKAGGKIPSDGTIVEGASSVNEAAITGESLPVDKSAGDSVFGGSLNAEGLLKIRIDKPYEDSSLAKILRLVQEAQETKTPTELFINRFAKYYTPLIMIAAVFVMLVPPLLFNEAWLDWVYQGLAVLIVGCPCALILSSPIAIVAGITRNARNGILVKGGVYLEQLSKIDILAFDKTGTLTKGKPRVMKIKAWDESTFFKAAYAMEKASSHPLAAAVLEAIAERQLDEELSAENIQTLPGAGMTASIDGETYYLGNEKSMSHLSFPPEVEQAVHAFKQEGLTLVLVADSRRVLGMFGIADEIREESRNTIAALRKLGIQTVMLTGDHEQSAKRVADAVEISTYYSNLLPEDKVDRIHSLSKQGKTAMVGDGINDAPALAAAHLGIAMGKGTDSAIETADIVLMQDHLDKLPEAAAVSKKMNRIIRFNITIALGLKLLALLLTIPGWLTLWIAILSDMGATVFVTLVSLSLLLQRPLLARGSRHAHSAAVHK